jgi:hypothetical protein
MPLLSVLCRHVSTSALIGLASTGMLFGLGWSSLVMFLTSIASPNARISRIPMMMNIVTCPFRMLFFSELGI